MPDKTNAAGLRPAALPSDAFHSSSARSNYTTTASPPLDLERLLSRVDLEALVRQAGAELRRAGHELRGACPLHAGDNRTAFAVYAAENGHAYWRCYSRCNAGGDAIDFVRRWKNLDFLGAVRFLAEFAGLSLDEIGFSPASAQREAEKRKRSDVLDEAARYFASRLSEHEGAQSYLVGRGFTQDTIARAGWGYTNSDGGLSQHLRTHRSDLTRAQQLGVVRRDGLDFTANANGQQASPSGYIVMPHFQGGHVVYFSARAITPPEQMPDPQDKSRNLPGERQVYWALVPGDPDLVIVEGQMDAESLRQWGCSALALCGLGSLPPEDLRLALKRRKVRLALDRDELKSDVRLNEIEAIRERWLASVERLCAQTGPLTLVLQGLPAKDFNELLQGAVFHETDLAELLKTARPWIEFLLARLKEVDAVDLEALLQRIAALLPALPETLRNRYMRQVEKQAGISHREFLQLLNSQVTTPADGGTGIYTHIQDGALHFMGEPLGNFHARITHEQAVDDGLHPPSVRYTITGGLASGQPLPAVQIEARDFAHLDWIPGHWGMRPIIHLPPGKQHLLARAIQEISQADVIQERLYTYTGWTEKDGRRGFLSAGGLLTADGLDTSVRVDLGGNNLRHYALPDPPTDMEQMRQAARASLEFLLLGPRHVTAPVWAAMFAAPLSMLRSLNAVLAVYGVTQSGKSTLVHLALTHFGPGFIQGHDYHAPIDWTSTTTAIEGAMFTVKDAPLVIDDFAPQFTSAPESRSMHKKAHYVVRSVGNRSARGRSQADLSQQTTRVPRGLAIMTAENPLFGQSIVGRLLYVEVQPGEVLPDVQRGDPANERLNQLQTQAQQGLLAQAMAIFVQYVALHWQRIAELFPEMVDAASNQARQEASLQNRLPDAFGVLNAAQMTALRCFQDLGLISGAEASRLAEENRLALLSVITNQAERVAAESPVRKFFLSIASLLERRRAYLAPRTQSVEFSPPINADLIGYFEPQEPDVVYLRTEACLIGAKKFWRELDENLDIMPDALRRQLMQVPGLLSQIDKRQVEALKYCGGVNQRVLVVNSRQVESLYSVILTNPPDNPGSE